jgi:hypothetical protein
MNFVISSAPQARQPPIPREVSVRYLMQPHRWQRCLERAHGIGELPGFCNAQGRIVRLIRRAAAAAWERPYRDNGLS